MKLEDYINNYRKPKEEKPKLEFSAFELYYYKDIDRKKKKLLRETFKFLGTDDFCDALERREKAIDTSAYYQSASESGIRGLVRIETCTENGKYGLTRPIEEEKFFADYNSRYMIGEQKYKVVEGKTQSRYFNTNYEYKVNIIYTADGGVFLEPRFAKQIEAFTLDELGNCLADICIKEEERLERINGTNKAK